MATNISYASGDTNLTSLILHILPRFGEHGKGIVNSNKLTAALNAKGAVDNVEGGLEPWAGIMKAESSNFKWQGKNDDVTVNSQDPVERLRWDWKVFTGAITNNQLDAARNRGRAAIKQYLMTLRDQAKATIGNSFNSAWWDTTPATDAPNSIPNLISATPTTGSIGGLNRSGNEYLQNGAYTTAIADIGSEAGLAKMHQLRIENSVGNNMADLIMMGSENFAGLMGYLIAQRRWIKNDKMAELGFDSIEDNGALITYENTNVVGGANTINSSYMYGLPTKNLRLQHLINPASGENGWTAAAERVGKTLNDAFYYSWFGQLVINEPRASWVATDVSTT